MEQGVPQNIFLQFEPRSLALMAANEGMLSKAKEKLQPVPPSTNLSFKHVVLPDMPYDDNSFDAARINLDGDSFMKYKV